MALVVGVLKQATRRPGKAWGCSLDGLSNDSNSAGRCFFRQWDRTNFLREIEGGLQSCEGKRAYLGIEPLSRLSWSYANSHHP